MITPSERVRNLAQGGTFPAAQAQALLSALGPAQPVRRSVLTDPLDRFGGERLALVGLAGAVAGVAMYPLGVRFDGFLDLHASLTATLWAALVDVLGAWPLGATLLWVVARSLGSQGRYIDFLGLVGVARVPLVAVAVPTALLLPGPGSFEPGKVPEPSLRLLLGALVALVGVVWMMVILYRGFVTASGLRGARRVVAFMVAVLLAEIASKLLLMALT
jgi:hypothetical protein